MFLTVHVTFVQNRTSSYANCCSVPLPPVIVSIFCPSTGPDAVSASAVAMSRCVVALRTSAINRDTFCRAERIAEQRTRGRLAGTRRSPVVGVERGIAYRKATRGPEPSASQVIELQIVNAAASAITLAPFAWCACDVALMRANALTQDLSSPHAVAPGLATPLDGTAIPSRRIRR